MPNSKPETRRGLFVAFEGGEGAGKSTQVGLLVDRLKSVQRQVRATREPGGVPMAESLRALVLDPAYAPVDPRAEALIFAAARSAHVHGLIRPLLDQGVDVVCDRYIDSSVAYQGHARGLGADRIRELSLWATDFLEPDLTVLLDVDPRVGVTRAREQSVGGDRMEQEDVSFHQMVRQAFLDEAAAGMRHYAVVEAGASPQSVHEQVWRSVESLIRT